MDYLRYTVLADDTIFKIAKNYNVEMAEIIHLNQLKHPDRIYAGQILLLPLPAAPEPVPDEPPDPNFTYAIWLYDAYAGKDSELTAATTYLYQAVLLDRSEFDDLLRPIAYDEIGHLEKLALALRYLNVDPKYGSLRNGQWFDWRSGFVNYTGELCLLLEQNIADEARDHRKYLELAQKIPIPEIQALLLEMAADEERHHRLFCQARQQYCSEYASPALSPYSLQPLYAPFVSPEIRSDDLKPPHP